MNELPALFGLTLDELETLAAENGWPRYAGKQITQWLYRQQVDRTDRMTNLPMRTRKTLGQRYRLGVSLPEHVQISRDGTRKYLFPAGEKRFVEAACIPDEKRNTLCLSCQVGCKMGCIFCMTGKQGFHGSLTAGEIVNQYRSLPERDRVTNIVYMGMGEPFDNLNEVLKSTQIFTAEWGYAMSPRRITVSTIGLTGPLHRFLRESQCHLAVSLHSPFEGERRQLMPVASLHPLKELISELRNFDFGRQRRLSFEYIMFRDVNDTPRHIRELARLLNGLRCRVNLIRFHPVPGISLESSDERTMEQFMLSLNRKGIRTTIRASRGQDISAACGMLSTAEQMKQ